MGWLLEEHQRLPTLLGKWTLTASIQRTPHRCPTKKTHLNLLREDPTNHNHQNSLRGHTYRTQRTTISKYRTWLSPLLNHLYQGIRHVNDWGMVVRMKCGDFFEYYHQQYLHKNPNGYCGLRGTGVECKL